MAGNTTTNGMQNSENMNTVPTALRTTGSLRTNLNPSAIFCNGPTSLVFGNTGTFTKVMPIMMNR